MLASGVASRRVPKMQPEAPRVRAAAKVRESEIPPAAIRIGFAEFGFSGNILPMCP